MEEQLDLKIRDTLEAIKTTLDATIVVGDPITLGDKHIVPIVKASFMLGTGGGRGVGPKTEMGTSPIGEGKGYAITGNVNPVALIVSYDGVTGKEGIDVIELNAKGGLAEALASLAPLVGQIMGERKASAMEEEDEKKELMEI